MYMSNGVTSNNLSHRIHEEKQAYLFRCMDTKIPGTKLGFVLKLESPSRELF